jgi:hypothetical protein
MVTFAGVEDDLGGLGIVVDAGLGDRGDVPSVIEPP